MRWHIFCRVIDNYGDAGVCWRLASDLNRRGERVTLLIDEPKVLTQLAASGKAQSFLTVLPWPKETESFAPADTADVIIEAFACDPPSHYVAAMAQRAEMGNPPVWINLEYLSAEAWVGEHHGLKSPHPRYPLIKHFYFPGFTPDSGGLIREVGTVEFFTGPAEQHDESHAEKLPQPIRIFLFCYEQPALQAWITALDHTILSLAPCPARNQLMQGHFETPATLMIRELPFVPQMDFDALLKDQDFLFVRGEDSFVRAQWAGIPLVWHIYPQADGVHLVKLRAFYERYLDPDILTPEQRETFMRFLLAWNGAGNPLVCAELWPNIVAMLPGLLANALAWRETLLKQADLVTQLRAFVGDLIK